MLNLSLQEDRSKLAQSVTDESNLARKQWSLRQFEIQCGRIQQYVKENLENQYDIQSVKEMPIVSSINIQKRIVSKKATIYKKAPMRKFTNINDDQKEVVDLIYKDMCINQKLNVSNKGFVYQDQSIGMILPKNGKLIARIFKMHQIDAIASEVDPEVADGFIISVFDRENYIQLYKDKKEKDTATGKSGRSVRSSAYPIDGVTSEVANEMQFKKYVERYLVWTPEYNYMQNGLGEVLDPETMEALGDQEIESPLIGEGCMPFFEASREKDFEYFVRASNALTDFTIEFNSRLTDESNNIKMNGYAVGVLKGPSELQPENQVIGAAMLLKLATDDPDAVVDFEFVSPNSNIGEISSANDKFLNYFVTAEGLGAEAINSQGIQDKATSGIDRFIQGIQKIEAHQDDYEVYRNVEMQIYKIIKAWLRVLNGSDKLDKKYQIILPEDSEIMVEYDKPEMIQTPGEMLTNWEKEYDLGLTSKVRYLMDTRSISREDALEELKQVSNDEKEIYDEPEIEEVPDLTEEDMDLGADNEKEIDAPEMKSANPSASKVDQGIQEQEKLLNGAQVTAVMGVVEKYKTKVLDKTSAVQLLQTAFGMEESVANKILGAQDGGSIGEDDDKQIKVDPTNQS